jgi:glycerophosphoryl diester phosphodiesterase
MNAMYLTTKLDEILCRYGPYLQEQKLLGKQLVTEAHKLGLMVHTWTFTNSREDSTIKQYFEGSEIKGKSSQLSFFLPHLLRYMHDS